MNFSFKKRNNDELYYAFVINALIVTLFLFYIDEGFNSFNWMLSVSNWLVFFIYGTFILIVQEIMGFFLAWTPLDWKSKLILVTVVLIIGLGFIFS